MKNTASSANLFLVSTTTNPSSPRPNIPVVAGVVVGASRAEGLGAVEEGGGDETEVDGVPESAAERGELENHGLLLWACDHGIEYKSLDGSFRKRGPIKATEPGSNTINYRIVIYLYHKLEQQTCL